MQGSDDGLSFRFHGPQGPYKWALTFSAWAQENRADLCYFDNDEAGYAAKEALRLRGMIGEG